MSRWIPWALGLAVAAAGAFAGWKVRDLGHRQLRERVGADQLAALRQRLDDWNRLPATERQRITRLHEGLEAEPARLADRLRSAGWYAQVRELMPPAERRRLDEVASVSERVALVTAAAEGSIRELEEYRADVGKRLAQEFRRTFSGPPEFNELANLFDELATGRIGDLKGPLKRLSRDSLERHQAALHKLAPEDQRVYAFAMLAVESAAIGDEFRKSQAAKMARDLFGRSLGEQLPKTKWWQTLFKDRKFGDLSAEELAVVGRFVLWAVKSETPLPEEEIARRLPESDPIRLHLKETAPRPFGVMPGPGPFRPHREVIAIAWYFDADRLRELGRTSVTEELEYRKLLQEAKLELPGGRSLERPGMNDRPLLPGDRLRKAAKKMVNAGKTKDN